MKWKKSKSQAAVRLYEETLKVVRDKATSATMGVNIGGSQNL